MKISLKTRYPRVFLLAFNIVLILGLGLYSCATTAQKNQTVHESIIGTKWVSSTNTTDSIEFIDVENCILVLKNTITGKTSISTVPYRVEEKKIIIGNGLIWYEYRRATLYFLGQAAQKKV